MNNFPNNSDKLFQETLNPSGLLMQRSDNKFFLYSEGYKQAGQLIYEKIIADEFYSMFLVYPMIFNFRQYIELRLKELTIMGYKYLAEDCDFNDTHDLNALFKKLRNDILNKINETDSVLLDNVQRLMHEFNKIDPGFSFRYPLTRSRPDGSRQPSLTMSNVDVQCFKASFDKLVSFLEHQWDTLTNYQELKDEHISEMMSQMYYFED
ncbi:hypothetical protein [Pedobacter antarcticus]|uniref:hypothetical protein n=1 Tax=Pedobacter antarcticus TaxID=34086 RepID=UPI00292F3900|nr:hypothetical protein [Pedobacter antarcticus]